MKKFLPYFFIFLFCTLYIFSAYMINHSFTSSGTNYYVYLWHALTQGKINLINPPNTYDLSLYHGKWFLNWGPGALLFIAPFYLLQGLQTSDVIFTLVAGITNVILFYLILIELQKAFSIHLSSFSKFFLISTFGIASPNFYLSLSGQIWFSEQVISILYLFLFYYFYFRFLRKETISELIAAVIFFNLAWITRYTLIFQGLLFLYPLFLFIRKQKKLPIKQILLVITITLCFMSMIFVYNFAKFHNPFETGLRYHQGNSRFLYIIQEHKFFSSTYIPYNAVYYFRHLPNLTANFPYIQFDYEGNSIFVIYPALLLFLFLIKRGIKQYLFFSISLFVVFCSLITLLCYFTTGWTQLGSRYIFDILPLLYLLLAFVVQTIPWPVLVGILLYEIPLQILGVIWFYGLFK